MTVGDILPPLLVSAGVSLASLDLSGLDRVGVATGAIVASVFLWRAYQRQQVRRDEVEEARHREAVVTEERRYADEKEYRERGLRLQQSMCDLLIECNRCRHRRERLPEDSIRD